MLAIGRLVRIVKTIGDKVISKSRFYNTFKSERTRQLVCKTYDTVI